MKTLFTRLKKEYKDLLADELKQYPESTEVIVQDLTNNFYVSDLRYGTIVAISNLDVKKAKASGWDYFNE